MIRQPGGELTFPDERLTKLGNGAYNSSRAIASKMVKQWGIVPVQLVAARVWLFEL